MNNFKQAHFWFHKVATGVFCTGIFLHLTGLVIGREALVHRIYTPTFDAVFALPMIYAALFHWIYLKQVDLAHPLRRVAYYFTVFYLTLSVPLHVRTILVQDTSFVMGFPDWYGYFILPVQALLAYSSWTLAFKPTPAKRENP